MKGPRLGVPGGCSGAADIYYVEDDVDDPAVAKDILREVVRKFLEQNQAGRIDRGVDEEPS